MRVPRITRVIAVAATMSALCAGGGLGAVETANSSEGTEIPVVEEEIQVVDDWPEMPTVTILSREELPEVPIGDGADLLRGVSGVSVGRMGGHGLEPRVRGLGEGSLNVQVDGAFVHGGCPNRMDPPTSFAAPNAFDEVTVIKGVQSLRYGPGGTAGTVLFQRNVPVFSEPTDWRAEVATSYGSWHKNPELGVDASLGAGKFFLRAQAGVRSFDNYEDGSGEEVRSAFDSQHANVMLGYGRAETGQLELGIEAIRTDDALFAGAGMDSPEDAADTFRLKLRRSERWIGLVDLRADLYYNAVDHLMDNYSLRPLTAPMAMRVPSTSDTYGGRASADRKVTESLSLSLGFEYQENARDALRYAGPNPEMVAMLQSVMWPDANLGQGGLFLEGVQSLGTKSRLILGGRVDRFSAEANKADVKPAGMNRSPNQLYESYYGLQAEDWSATEWGGLARFERLLRPELTLFAGLSRSARAHGQEGILQSDNATIYRNIEARLTGLEAQGSVRPGSRWQLAGVVSWVLGDNRTDDRPLAQIPPLEGWLQLDYRLDRWGAMGLFRWADNQDRVDDDPTTGSGQDYGETPGYGLLDLSGRFRIVESLSIFAGVDNVFDRTYANHLNRANLFDPDPVQINEPGRTFWVRLTWRGGAF